MGCDRNLFTLRLVSNQTRGKWLWQAAAEGWGQGAGVAEENGWGLSCRTGPALQPPFMVEGHLQGLWDGQKYGGIGKGWDVWGEPTMSDVLITRHPVPRPPWNDYQTVTESRHESSFLSSGKCTVTQSEWCDSQSARSAGKSLISISNESCSKHKPAKLAFGGIFLSLIGMWPVRYIIH